METIEELIQLQPEEVYSDEEARDAGIEYQRDLAFANWQLRANALLNEAWAAYRQQSEIEKAVSGLHEKHREAMSAKVSLAMFADVREISVRAFALFNVWSSLSKLARAEGREDITPQQEADAMAIVTQMEEVHIEKLMERQATRRAEKVEVKA